MKSVMYLGERVSWQGVYQLFKDRAGKEYHYRGVKGVWFGSVYKMLSGDKMKIRPDESKQIWEPTALERDEYEAQKIVVKAFRQEKRKAMQIKKPHEKITRAIELIRPFYFRLDNVDRRRFMTWFANECSRKGRR